MALICAAPTSGAVSASRAVSTSRRIRETPRSARAAGIERDLLMLSLLRRAHPCDPGRERLAQRGNARTAASLQPTRQTAPSAMPWTATGRSPGLRAAFRTCGTPPDAPSHARSLLDSTVRSGTVLSPTDACSTVVEKALA